MSGMVDTAVSDNSSHSVVSNEKQNLAFDKDAFLSPDFNPKHLNLIIQEGIILAAGAAAILLQVAEAGVGHGVNQHSNFAYRVQDRLRTTMTYVYCMSYGTPEEKKVICDMIYKVHSQVNGTLDDGRDKGKSYSALDPELQMWVAATLYATGVETHARVFGEIKDDDLLEKIYREYSILACSLQVPPEMWPPTRRAFWEYWDRKCSDIEVTHHAKAICDDLLSLRHAPWHLRIAMPGIRVVTAEIMPPRIRDAYGIKVHHKTYKALLFLVKATYRPLPLVVRTLPARFYMKDMRKRLRNHRKIFDKAG